MKRTLSLLIALSMLGGTDASGAVTSNTQHGPAGGSLNGSIAVGDLISGLNGTELAGDQGWHPANPAAGNSLHPFGLPTFTDDAGGSGLMGLLNDNAPGAPVKRVQYDLASASDIRAIQILTGNDGTDGRVFSTTAISASTDGGSSFSPVGLGYFESDPLGTINSGQWGSTLVRIFDDSGAPLVTGATNLIFEFYSVDNTQGEYRDPFDGVNPFTNVDDGLTAAFVSPLVWEVDVIGVPEPATVGLAGMALLGAVAVARRTRAA